jgi:hypothetical protein
LDSGTKQTWRNTIREVFNRDWDPICGCPEDEYDSFIEPIGELLRDGASDEKMLAYFKWAEVEYIGLGSKEQFNQKRIRDVIIVIEKLRKIGAPP